MRIAVVHSFYTAAQPSGENSVVTDQVAALQDAGHDVELVAKHTDEEARRPAYSLRAAGRVLSGRGASPSERLEAFQPDVVHLHNTFPNWGTRWLDAWSSRTVATVHNFRPVCAAGTLFRDGAECTECLELPTLPALKHRCYRDSRIATIPLAVATGPRGNLRRIVASAREVVVLNSEMQRVYQAAIDRAVNVVPNFVDDGGSECDAPSGWIYVGRLAHEKGILELLAHWPANERLDIFGSGPLESHVAAASVRLPFVTLHHQVPRAELLRRLPTYEGLMLPSLWPEGLPTVVLEALAAGVPVAISDRVAAGRDLQQAGAAVLFEAMNGGSVASALMAIRSGGTTLRTTARDLHRANFSRESWTAAVSPIYERVLAANS